MSFFSLAVISSVCLGFNFSLAERLDTLDLASFQLKMAEEKESTSVPLSQTGGNGGEDPEDPEKTPPASPNSSTRKVWFLNL